MTTKAEYDAGTLAALRIIQRDIDGDLPPRRTLFRDVSPGAVREFAQAVAQAAIDAAAQVRARIQRDD